MQGKSLLNAGKKKPCFTNFASLMLGLSLLFGGQILV